MQYRYCSHWNPSHKLVIFIIYVQSWPQKPKRMLYGKLDILLFTEILPLCNLSFHLLMVFADLCGKMYTQIRCSDSGNLNIWLKSEQNQFTPPQGLIQALRCSRGSCCSLKPGFRVCSATMCCCKDSLVARNREGCLRERNKQQGQRNL